MREGMASGVQYTLDTFHSYFTFDVRHIVHAAQTKLAVLLFLSLLKGECQFDIRPITCLVMEEKLDFQMNYRVS